MNSCAFEALAIFLPKNIRVWLSLSTVERILEDCGYDVVACKVLKTIHPPEVDIGFKNEHYYSINESYGEFPDVVFMSAKEIDLNQDSIRVLSDEEASVIKGGKGGMTMNYPATPAAPTVGESVQEWADVQPQIMQQQLEFAPQEAAQQVELAQQYAEPLGAAFQQAQAAMYPETTALQEQLSTRASEGMNAQQMPSWMQEQYRSDLSANMGSNVGSPIGADYMSRGMQQQAQNYRGHYENLALSAAGRQPLAQPQAPQTSNYMQQFGPQQAMNMNVGTYGPEAAASRPFPYSSKGGLMGWLGM